MHDVVPDPSQLQASIQHQFAWLYGLGIVALAGVSLYLRAYITRKAEHLATKEQFHELLKQQKETTHATEVIKAQIGGGLWVQQEKWRRKWDVYAPLLRYYTAAAKHVRQLRKLPDIPNEPKTERLRKLLAEEGGLAAEVVSAKLFALVVLPQNVVERTRKLDQYLGSMMTHEEFWAIDDITNMLHRALSDHAAVLIAEARDDLRSIRTIEEEMAVDKRVIDNQAERARIREQAIEREKAADKNVAELERAVQRAGGETDNQ